MATGVGCSVGFSFREYIDGIATNKGIWRGCKVNCKEKETHVDAVEGKRRRKCVEMDAAGSVRSYLTMEGERSLVTGYMRVHGKAE